MQAAEKPEAGLTMERSACCVAAHEAQEACRAAAYPRRSATCKAGAMRACGAMASSAPCSGISTMTLYDTAAGGAPRPSGPASK